MRQPSDRFERQQRFAPLGPAGQARLREARVLVVGCGALGGVLAQTLVRSGIGELVLVDRDLVEHSNLPRQVLFEDRHAAEATSKIAAALETGAIGPAQRFDTGDGTLAIPGKTIRDHHPYGVLDPTGVLQVSSNIGAVMIANLLGAEDHYDALRGRRKVLGVDLGLPVGAQDRAALRVQELAQRQHSGLAVPLAARSV